MTQDLISLSGYYCGVVTTVSGSEETIDALRKEWASNGMICWINRPSPQSNQEYLDDE